MMVPNEFSPYSHFTKLWHLMAHVFIIRTFFYFKFLYGWSYMFP